MRKFAAMITDNIVLIETEGKFVLADNCTCNLFLLNKVSFHILQAYKKGTCQSVIEQKYGKTNVDRVFRYLKILRENQAIRILDKNRFDSSEDIINNLDPKQPELAESVFMLAQDCNMRCKYCYGDGGEFGNAGFMSRKMAKSFFDILLKNSGKNSVQRVKFLGGEPLLNFDTLKYIVDLWEQMKEKYQDRTIKFALTTNGTLFTSEIIQYIRKKKIGVTVSLDGSESIQDSNRKFCDGSPTYASVMKGIELLEKNDISYTIRATVTSDTNLEELYSFFCSQNFEIVHIVPADYPQSSKREDYQWDFKQYKKYAACERNILSEGYRDILVGMKDSFQAKQMKFVYEDLRRRNAVFPFKCSAGWWSVVFSSDGYIYPCHRLVGNEYNRIGNYRKGICVEKIKKMYLQILKASTKCNSCIAFTFCKRRCMAQMAENGTFQEIPEELCEIYRETYKHSLALFLKLQDLQK